MPARIRVASVVDRLGIPGLLLAGATAARHLSKARGLVRSSSRSQSTTGESPGARWKKTTLTAGIAHQLLIAALR
jgi:hypothetical protein